MIDGGQLKLEWVVEDIEDSCVIAGLDFEGKDQNEYHLHTNSDAEAN